MTDPQVYCCFLFVNSDIVREKKEIAQAEIREQVSSDEEPHGFW